MKLPEDKKERTQILVLIMVGVVAVLYALFQIQVNLISKPRKAAEREIAKLENDIRMAGVDIDAMDTDLVETGKMMQEIRNINAKYILHPRLGDNYLLSAKEILKAHALKMDIDPVISDIGMADIQQKTSNPIDFAFKTYTVRVELKEGLHKLVEFLDVIETSNPHFCVCNMTIMTQKDSMEKHEISFDVQWPIWSMNDLTSPMLKLLRQDSDQIKAEPTNSGAQLPTKRSAGEKDPSALAKPAEEKTTS